MLSPSPRLGTSNQKAANPKEDIFASSLCILYIYIYFFEFSTGASKSKEDVKGGPQPQDKGKDKKVQPPTKANYSENALPIRDVVSKAKDVESKSKAGDIKPKGS